MHHEETERLERGSRPLELPAKAGLLEAEATRGTEETALLVMGLAAMDGGVLVMGRAEVDGEAASFSAAFCMSRTHRSLPPNFLAIMSAVSVFHGPAVAHQVCPCSPAKQELDAHRVALRCSPHQRGDAVNEAPLFTSAPCRKRVSAVLRPPWARFTALMSGV